MRKIISALFGGPVECRTPPRFLLSGIIPVLLAAASAACSFDYGGMEESDKNKPDIVMEDIEYVRVRGGDPIVRFQAEYAERWEERQTMELQDFSFEQIEDHGETINATGKAGSAVVQLGSGNISLQSGVEINIDSEDFIIKTSGLEWQDKEKILAGSENNEVYIERSDGTSFSGRGFSSDIRSRSWNFTGEVKGRYVEEDDESSEPGSEDISGDAPSPRSPPDEAAAGPEENARPLPPEQPKPAAETPEAGKTSAPVQPLPEDK